MTHRKTEWGVKCEKYTKKEYLFRTNARNPFLGRIIRTVKISTILGDFLPSATLPPRKYEQITASLK
jgi:hypothetical protein